MLRKASYAPVWGTLEPFSNFFRPVCRTRWRLGHEQAVFWRIRWFFINQQELLTLFENGKFIKIAADDQIQICWQCCIYLNRDFKLFVFIYTLSSCSSAYESTLLWSQYVSLMTRLDVLAYFNHLPVVATCMLYTRAQESLFAASFCPSSTVKSSNFITLLDENIFFHKTFLTSPCGGSCARNPPSIVELVRG
jgi:hypothetical protein